MRECVHMSVSCIGYFLFLVRLSGCSGKTWLDAGLVNGITQYRDMRTAMK